MIESIFIFFWALLISLFSIPTIINIAHNKRILDTVDLPRKTHEANTPRLGGIAIFAGFIASLLTLGHVSDEAQRLLAGSLFIFLIGVKDDISGVSVSKKFFVQIVAAGTVLMYSDVRITSLQGLFGVYEIGQGSSYAFSFLVILCITNAINLIDGINGLAGVIVLFISITFGVYFYLMGVESMACVAFALAGAICGFLRYNLLKAKIFMGDTGALLSGFIVSILAIYFTEAGKVISAPALSVSILFIPIFDVVRVFVIRIYKGVSPFLADRNHIHHALSRLGLSDFQVTLTLLAINIGVFLFAKHLACIGDLLLLIYLVGFAILLSVLLEVITRVKKK